MGHRGKFARQYAAQRGNFGCLFIGLLAMVLALAGGAAAQKEDPGAKKVPTGAASADLSGHPTLYVVGYAHLDTQWRWEYPQVINEYIPKTMHANFDLFEKYPHYIFNFSGANRYRMMKDYFPADHEKLRQYVKAGRWFP